MALITVAIQATKSNIVLRPKVIVLFTFIQKLSQVLSKNVYVLVTDADSNQYWYTHAPNYFFPKMDHYPDLKTAALVFLASAMSLIMLILLLIVILYRMNSHVREQRELQSQLRTISELLGNLSIILNGNVKFLSNINIFEKIIDNNANEHTEENDAALEMPPAYEHPPDYDEASSVKINMNSRRSSRADGNRKRRRSRSRYNNFVQR